LLLDYDRNIKAAMRYPPDQKEKTRQRILDAAAAVFRRLGYRGAGVDAVMREAGLTAGGFYAQFPSKEALFAETLPHAMGQTRTLIGPDFDELAGQEWVRAVAARYLSPAHRRLVDRGCPLPALLPEVARAAEPSKQAFEAVLRQVASNIAAHVPPTAGGSTSDQALALLALLVGGMTLARAVADESLSDRILAACRKFAEAGVGGKQPSPRSRRKRKAEGRAESPARTRKGDARP
jgi:TetR/AcrR family transcriptional repressor of nem operon